MNRKPQSAEYRWWFYLCLIGSQMTVAAVRGDHAGRAGLEREYADALARLRRLRAA